MLHKTDSVTGFYKLICVCYRQKETFWYSYSSTLQALVKLYWHSPLKVYMKTQLLLLLPRKKFKKKKAMQEESSYCSFILAIHGVFLFFFETRNADKKSLSTTVVNLSVLYWVCSTLVFSVVIMRLQGHFKDLPVTIKTSCCPVRQFIRRHPARIYRAALTSGYKWVEWDLKADPQRLQTPWNIFPLHPPNAYVLLSLCLKCPV